MAFECWVSRSGYSGEDGYEISIPAGDAEAITRALLEHKDVELIGLGARDSLRLESGLCLYGRDITAQTSPIEASLAWAIQKSRKAGGARAGGFLGSDVILNQLDNGIEKKRVGLQPKGRAPMREGVVLYETEESSTAIGEITSGGFGPTVNAPVAMGYVRSNLAAIGTQVFGELRKKRLPLEVCSLPFTPTNFKR